MYVTAIHSAKLSRFCEETEFDSNLTYCIIGEEDFTVMDVIEHTTVCVAGTVWITAHPFIRR